MKIDLNSFDESVLGRHTDDPLRFAFDAKHSAHAGGGSSMVSPQSSTTVLDKLYQTPGRAGDKRCLYIHVPFCRVRCTFCNFFQNAASRRLVDEYFDALMLEIEQKSQFAWTQSAVFQAVYVGGGTPTDLSSEQIQQLGQRIRSAFPLASDCEITLEGRINRFSDEMFERALEGGFNRFSFGVQSFDTKVRRSAKRLDDRDTVLERLSQLSARDDALIIIDLLYGLPHQSAEVFEQDLRDFLSTGAHGLDLYQLVVGGDAPMLNLVEKGKLPPPASSTEKALLYKIGVEFMRQHHFRPLSVNHWARDNRERSLYNSLAKTSADVLPLGCGAGGTLGGYSVMQHRHLQAYLQAIETQQMPVMMLSKQHDLASVFAALKAAFDSGVLRRYALPKVFGVNLFGLLHPLFVHWDRLGLAKLEKDYLSLTLAGGFWSVTLTQACIRILLHTYQNTMKPCLVAS